jgi:hypothetical protein
MGRKVTRTKVNRNGSQVPALEIVVEFGGGGGIRRRRRTDSKEDEGSQMPALGVDDGVEKV